MARIDRSPTPVSAASLSNVVCIWSASQHETSRTGTRPCEVGAYVVYGLQARRASITGWLERHKGESVRYESWMHPVRRPPACFAGITLAQKPHVSKAVSNGGDFCHHSRPPLDAVIEGCTAPVSFDYLKHLFRSQPILGIRNRRRVWDVTVTPIQAPSLTRFEISDVNISWTVRPD